MELVNVLSTDPEEFRLGPEKLISAYRDKNRVEEGFKELAFLLKYFLIR